MTIAEPDLPTVPTPTKRRRRRRSRKPVAVLGVLAVGAGVGAYFDLDEQIPGWGDDAVTDNIADDGTRVVAVEPADEIVVEAP